MNVLLFCHLVILLFCHFVISLFCHFVILLFCYFVILSFCYVVVLLFCYFLGRFLVKRINHCLLFTSFHKNTKGQSSVSIQGVMILAMWRPRCITRVRFTYIFNASESCGVCCAHAFPLIGKLPGL